MIGKSTPFAQKILLVISIIGLIVVGVTVLIAPMIYRDKAIQQAANNDTEQAAPKVIGADPYVTFVPKDQRSTSSKTNIFISSLDPIYGPNTAKVYVIVFGSILDTNVHAVLSQVSELQAKYNENIAFVWKDYFDTTDTKAMNTAVIMQCVNELGRFWEMSALLASVNVNSADGVVSELDKAGISSLQYSDCQANAGYSALVTQGINKAKVDGIESGATVYVNNESFPASSITEIDAAIEAAIQSYSSSTTE